MTGARRRLLLAIVAGVLGVGLIGGGALASFAPTEAPSSRAEKDKPGKGLAAILDKMVEEGKLTDAQRDEILRRLGAERQDKKRPAIALAKTMWLAAAEYVGLEPNELRERFVEGETLAEIAVDEGKDRAGLIDAMVEAANDLIDAALDEGDITEEQADRLRAMAAEQAEKLADRRYEADEHHKDKQRGEGEKGKPDFSKVNVHAFIGGYYKTAMTYLGLAADQLGKELRAGKSLADLVVAPKTRAGLIDAIVAPAEEKIDAARSGGRLTEAQAEELKEKVRDAVEHLVDAEGRVPAPKVERPKNDKSRGPAAP
jgi:polyhydroxyalkanoate synthesis regulator phasin